MQGQQPNEPSAMNSSRRISEPEDARCPFLVPVMVDRLWLYPVSAYCRRPDHPVRVPATSTFVRVCTDDYASCPGYQTSQGESDAGR